MKFLIYDNDSSDIENLKYCIKNFSDKINRKCFVHVCSNTEFLFNNINNFDCLFLDIELENENGITIGKELLKINNNIPIIITSKYRKYLTEGYCINAKRYLVKPISQKIFDTEMFQVYQSTILNNQLLVELKNEHKKITVSNILYLEYLDRITTIYLDDGSSLNTAYPLKYWIQKLNSFPFSQPHRAFYVNLYAITGFTNKDIALKNNYSVPLSRHYKERFENDYFQFLHIGI